MTAVGSAPADAEFVSRTQSFRRELLAHCYRMLGSVDEAEDLVQDTYLRAWRSYAGFEGRSSIRVWLYRIATNVCLSAIERRRERRWLPSGLGPAAEDARSPPVAAGSEVSWLQPIPDALLTAASEDPATIVARRESLRLALIASLQYLPGRQRAVLLLRDVLDFPAAEVAQMLDTSVPAVKSALQRARTRLEEQTPAFDDITTLTEPEQETVLQRYIAAFENADAAAFERLLRVDAALEFPPAATWFAGRATCVPCLARTVGEPGDWRMFPTTANGQPAAVSYLRAADGVYHAYGVGVHTVAPDGIARITAFGDPALARRFAMPLTFATGGRS